MMDLLLSYYINGDEKVTYSIKWMQPGSDIFLSKMQTLVNTVNCKGFMGKGLAKEFANKKKSASKDKKFGEMVEDYKRKCNNGEVKPGKPYLWKNPDLGGYWILNFPTKDHFAKESKLIWIEEGLDHFKNNYKEWGITSIAFPALGCNNGKLSWEVVKNLMEKKLSEIDDIEIEIYPPHESYSSRTKSEEQKTLETFQPASTIKAK